MSDFTHRLTEVDHLMAECNGLRRERDALAAQLAEAERTLTRVWDLAETSLPVLPDYALEEAIGLLVKIGRIAQRAVAPASTTVQPQPSRSVQRRVALQQGLPMPTFATTDQPPAALDDGFPRFYKPEPACSQCGKPEPWVFVHGCPESRGGCGRKPRITDNSKGDA